MITDRLPITPRELQRAQEITKNWNEVASSVSVQNKDQIGFLYIKHILGLGEEVAEKVVARDGSVWHQVGIAQSGIAPSEEGSKLFWEGIRDIDPRLVNTTDLSLLINHGGAVAACELVWTLDLKHGEFGEPQTFSGVLHYLKVNALNYK